MLAPIPAARLQGARYRHGAVCALDGLDLELHAGEVLALLGPNGAGKSTTVDLLLGLKTPDEGEARLFGADPRGVASRLQVGVMLQSAVLPERLTVRELIEWASCHYPHPMPVADAAALAGIGDLLAKRYGRLSGGQQRRVQFAIALCGQPRLLFLDEPTTGLDIGARAQVWAAVRSMAAQGCAVLLTTHYLEEAEALADRVVVLDRGRTLAAGTTAQVRALVGGRRIRCLTALPAEVVAGWPQVREAQVVGGRLEVVTGEAEAVVRCLLDADPALQELEVLRAGLAEAFVELTNPHAREAA
ncbi:ABC transporter ATP-binding protein [Luteimonas yindakuii]|uniref:ABC transporter ATP-binding protein n=1 Tax=Luteimonas yindakuii TaxID=2565782 RepID=A0A4Z1R352_9GAMM|nr:ABC transporter ATP-binding protein [Luteimonas yindakuii]TKS52975.1 ABC transporter ATP-binding protein [Luteimonas yindakuii]